MAALAGVCAVGAPGTIAAAPARPVVVQATTTPAGSAAPVASDNHGISAVRGSRSQTIQVWMSGRQQAAQRFAEAVSTPGSPDYRQYLSPSAYSQRFGPSAAQVNAVRSYLAGAGFTRVHASVNDDYVSAAAPVSAINRAFSVQMQRSEITGAVARSATIESNDRELTVPPSIGSDILAVTGLDSTQPKADDPATSSTSRRSGTRAPECSRYWAQKTEAISPAFHGITRAAVAVCGYSAKQIRAAYGLSSTIRRHTPTGKGKTIAIVVVGGPDKMFRTLKDYAKGNGLPRPRSAQYRQEAIGGAGRKRACDNGALDEAALDSEATYAMAPGADELMVEGNDCARDVNQALFDAELAPLTGHGTRASAAIESVSWGLGAEKDVPSSQRRISHAIALRAAAEGVSLLFSSGDSQGAQLQASDPDVTAVGGTTLGIGAHNRRVFETGWSDATGGRKGTSGPWRDEGIPYAAGGGTSALYTAPAYQQDVVPSSMAHNSAGHPRRAVPDISADADFRSGMLCGIIDTASNGKPTSYAPFLCFGTSEATPLVAGMVADAEQGQPRNFGFLNPLLYSLAGSHAFHDILPLSPSDPQVDRAGYSTFSIITRQPVAPSLAVFDDENPDDTSQVTAPGYDTMTGLGTPNGLAFISGLRSGR